MKHGTKWIGNMPGGMVLIMIIVLAACQPADHSAALKPAIDAYVNAWNTGELGGLDAVIAPDFVRTAPATSNSNAVGLDSLKSVIKMIRTAMPDLKVTLEDAIYSADKASFRWSVTGTNTGPMGMPPTGKTVKVTGISMMQFAEGKISRDWAQFDNQHFSQQLGFMVLPPAKPVKNDPVSVDAKHYKVAFENDRVRVLRITYGPGEKSVMHDHRDGVAVFFNDVKGKFTLPDGSSVDVTAKAKEVQWNGAASHLPENAGTRPFELVLVELKR